MNGPRDEAQLSDLVLGLPRRYTSNQISEAAGVPAYRARRFWRAFGFANVPERDVEFTEADAIELKRLLRLVSEGVFTERANRIRVHD